MADTCDLQNVEEDFAQPESESQQEPHVPQSTPKLDAVSESLLDLEFNQTAMSTGSIGMQKHGTPSETEVTIQPCEDQIQQCDSAGEKEDEAVDEADSDKDTVGDDRCSDMEDVDDDEELFDTKRQPDTARHYSISSLVEADGPGLYNSSSIDSLDLLAAANRQLLRQDPGNLDESLANDQSSEDFSDLVPNSSDRFGTSDSESLSSSLLDFAVAGQTSRRPSIRWINLIDENASVVFGSSTSVCGVCARKVYPMEMVTTNGVAYHKFCCKCAKCYRVLSLGNFGVLAGVIYCQTHYTEAVRLRDAPFDKKSANSENSEPPETSDPIRGWLKRRTSLADEQPPPGISKNILNFFHGLEQQQQQSSVQKEQKYPPLPQQQEQQPAVNNRLSVCTDESATPKLISPTSPAPPAAAPFVETSCPPQQSSEDSAEASPDTNNDCLPGQGTAKALLNLWRQKEAVGAGGESITDTGASVGCRERRGSLVKTSGSTATEVKPSNISRSASNLSRPKPAHIVPPPQPLPPPEHQQEQQQEQQEQQQQQQQDQEQQQKQQQQEQQEQQPDFSQDEGELPPANNTKSMLRLWRQFDQLGGPAPNPESFERLRYQQRSFRLPKRTVDERENVDPIQTSRQDQDQLLETTGELPPEGTTKNLRALFSS